MHKGKASKRLSGSYHSLKIFKIFFLFRLKYFFHNLFSFSFSFWLCWCLFSRRYRRTFGKSWTNVKFMYPIYISLTEVQSCCRISKKKLYWLPIRRRRDVRILFLFFSMLYSLNFSSYLRKRFEHSVSKSNLCRSCSSHLLRSPSHRISHYGNSFSEAAYAAVEQIAAANTYQPFSESF